MQYNPVVHFEMPALDKDRVAKFYETAFNWNMQKLGADMNEYILANTAETDAEGMNKTPGTINGGFFLQSPNEPLQAPHVVISVLDLKKQIDLVKQAGGEIIGESMDIPGIGTYVSIKDTEGNIVGVLQPVMNK